MKIYSLVHDGSYVIIDGEMITATPKSNEYVGIKGLGKHVLLLLISNKNGITRQELAQELFGRFSEKSTELDMLDAAIRTLLDLELCDDKS